MEMKTIASFQVDHTCLDRGMYLSRIDGDVVTYDLRFIRPNNPPFLEMPAVHTIEHLFATYVRNSPFGDRVIYFGPMGCRTGFYFLTRGMTHEEAISLSRDALRFIADFEGKISGATAVECGNFLEHDLPGAKKYAIQMLPILENWTAAQLAYTGKNSGNSLE